MSIMLHINTLELEKTEQLFCQVRVRTWFINRLRFLTFLHNLYLCFTRQLAEGHLILLQFFKQTKQSLVQFNLTSLPRGWGLRLSTTFLGRRGWFFKLLTKLLERFNITGRKFKPFCNCVLWLFYFFIRGR